MGGCRDKKSVSGMSNEEKIAYEVSDESRLSPDEKLLQTEVRQAILDRTVQTEKSTTALENAISEARQVLSESGFVQLKNAQQLWERQGRGKDINALVASGTPAGDAYVLAIQNRSEWVKLRSSWAMLIEIPGRFGGFYRADNGRTLEVYEMNEQKLNFVMRYHENEFVYTASGTASTDTGLLTSEFDALASVRAVRVNENVLRIELGDMFAESSLGRMGTLIEGEYQRVKSGEMDVFAQ